MKLLVLGGGGQVGRALVARGVTSSAEVEGIPRRRVDVTDARGVRAVLDASRADLVVNAAAYTDVDGAEADPDRAFGVNRDGARIVARACAAAGIPLLHLSTDYVFDGNKGAPYTEEDVPRPLGVYGRSKLDGEEAVRAACPRHVILRTSWVCGLHGENFVKTVLRIGRERSVVRVVDDQRGSPTVARDLADAMLRLAARLVPAKAAIPSNAGEPDRRGCPGPRAGPTGKSPGEEPESAPPSPPWGTYHYGGVPPATWHEVAEEVFRVASRCGYPAPRVARTDSASFGLPAPRPADSSLDSGLLRRTFGIAPRPWRRSVRELVETLLAEAPVPGP